MDSKILQLQIKRIRLDGSTQMRVELDSGVAAEYAENYRRKVEMPDPAVFHDGSHYWLADGFHRWHAMRQAGIKCASFRVFSGTQRDAFLYAAGCNARHGKRRRSEDIRFCARRMLEDEEWGKWSDRDIAARCKCSHPLVGDERRKLREEKARKKAREESSLETITSEELIENPAPPPETSRTYRTKHGTTATMDTAKIGKNGYRQRPVYPETEPKQLAVVLGQLKRSVMKTARQSLQAGWSEEQTMEALREARDSIPVVAN